MSEKPEALRLADLCDRHGYMGNIEHNQIAAELRRLHAECEALRQANEAFAQRQEWWNDRMCALEAECEALRADAMRYRWLRNEAWGGNNKQGPHLVEFKSGYVPSRFTDLAEEAADAAMDAAMAKEQTK